ncbi:MAG: alpha-xylosidase [Propionibacteriaceae bacterium]|jgi:alpha-D-xyloside xylohydrolase|nr:alpha-xylosidase [Propionibacteriaceae bacterium]
MKFTAGYWQLAPGVEAIVAKTIESVEFDEASLTAYCPNRELHHRGDTLNGPLITVSLSSPMLGVIRVRLAHHLGGRAPIGFVAASDRPLCTVEIRDESGWSIIDDNGCSDPSGSASGGSPSGNAADLPSPADRPSTTGPTLLKEGHAYTLTSGELSVTLRQGGPFALEFRHDGQLLTQSGGRGSAHYTVGGESYLASQLGLGIGESIYGLGERFGAFTKNGQVVDIWNEDGGTSSELAYKNVPFYLSSAGYGVLVNQAGPVSFEVGTAATSAVQFSAPGETLEYLIFDGPTPKEVLERYTAVTGRPPALPEWSRGLWLSTSFTTEYDEATVNSFIDGFEQRGIPLSVFHFDCFWMRQYHWCDFVWDPAMFPDPEGMLARLHQRGLKVCVWINPYIAQRSYLFAEGAAQGFLVKREDGSVWQWDMWQAGMALVDFTNPEAAAWYCAKLEALLDQGVDCFKTDFGERIPTDVVWHDGSDPHQMHNYYAQLYNQAVFELLRRRRGEGEAILFARAATAGGQQFPVHWGGDCESTFVSMAESLRGGLSLALSGFGYWSHDIGGFEGLPDPAVFKRWCAFGLLSSHSRLHGSTSYRVPWAFDEEAVAVLKHFTLLKASLSPYLERVTGETVEHGWPMMRPMMLEFPDDPACAGLDRQYMLGDSLLVAPVFTASGEVDYYLPDGQWTRLDSGEPVTGGRWVHETHSMMSLPLLVREGCRVERVG